MNLPDYWKSLTPAEKSDLARKAGTTYEYLQQLVGGHRKPGIKLAKSLETASGGVLHRSELRPDVWSPGEFMR